MTKLKKKNATLSPSEIATKFEKELLPPSKGFLLPPQETSSNFLLGVQTPSTSHNYLSPN
jgi:hypothetical protein